MPDANQANSGGRTRLRDLGIVTGILPPGPHNAITDVAGVTVGYRSVIVDEPHVVRTGVTAIWPRGPGIWADAVYAGGFSFNGNGEMTGMAWIAEQGMLSTPIGVTNTHAVGAVHEAICRLGVRDGVPTAWMLPVVAETYDGWLSDRGAFAITPQIAMEAFDAASSALPAEGNVGGGTGMICHEFKGGTGTASRVVSGEDGPWTVGALVQANYGMRPALRVAGAPVGRTLDYRTVPSPFAVQQDAGSIIVILATDAPLLPIQCQRLARRATTGLAWVGGYGANGSGDIFLAFATGNHLRDPARTADVRMAAPDALNPLFQAAAEATEEAILNALVAAETMTGFAGHTVQAIPHDLLKQSVLGTQDS
ncbi:MAG: P1 family peptidase [Caulobacteraceae bacterium]|nr:P1 family peptidase [Caulobacteraceae bacterium]